MRNKRALISVSDKNGIIELSKTLKKNNWEILSTGGTTKVLRDNEISVIDVEDITEFPELLNGRVKTLHPKIYGGLLAIHENNDHLHEIKYHQIELIDLLVVNLYPFKQKANDSSKSHAEIVENIDIGGPAMIRAAAKNYQYITVVINPNYYPKLINYLNKNSLPDEQQRCKLAEIAFGHTFEYDQAISCYLGKKNNSYIDNQNTLTKQINLNLIKKHTMRYGENPHQIAGIYSVDNAQHGLLNVKIIQGKEMSFNNYADADAALNCIQELDQPACVIIKHTNPCGVAIGKDIYNAYQKAYGCDPISAFGGIIAFNQKVDKPTATAINQQFAEVVLAPKYSEDALEILSKKKNLRIVQFPTANFQSDSLEFRSIQGGFLVQSKDAIITKDQLQTVTQKSPDDQELAELKFGFTVTKHVKSNAIVLSKNFQAIGIGAGQTSRIDSTKIAIKKAQDQGFELNGAFASSDAFFPFRDGIDELARAGIKAVIQPGGSIKDSEVITAADQHGIKMVFTNIRHFRH